MKAKNKNSYDINISFLGEIQDHQIDDNFRKLWNKIGEKYFDKKKSKTISTT